MSLDKFKKKKDWKLLEFYMPIKESNKIGDEFLIKGVAINETTTRNNVKYIAEELEKAAPSFRNKPILLDHKNEINSIVGRTTQNITWNPIDRRIEFEARIMDETIQNMISDGRIQDVSIGASVQDLTEEKDGSMKAVGVEGMELSFVAVPGDPGANLAQAMQESFKLKEEDGIEEEPEEESEEVEVKTEIVTVNVDDEIDEEVPYEKGEAGLKEKKAKTQSKIWGAINKEDLPDESFAWIETEKTNDKTVVTRHLPYKYKDGTLSRRGVAAAWSAIHGGRGSRTKWPSSVVAKITAARKKLGMDRREKLNIKLIIN